ncbi:hypothetical protein AZE42_05438 [Rhizopogon vesiculosus]|uniref:Uncharacterized protein n=1 Tax=Rhizopogon vesiculosus TaxID=180088 RepID=A0A1J8R8W3_9AGAM|nr:hypothetical protein AZE42_05438 [Rhizopogon vesiculosus]
MSDSSSLAGSEFTADDGLAITQNPQSEIVFEDTMAGDAVAMDEAADNGLSNTQHAYDRYLVRFQIWDPRNYVWTPYDPSHIKPIAPREDLYNYFYLDVRYTNEQSHRDFVVTNFSAILVDFLRYAIGDDFFRNNPEYPLEHFFRNQKTLKADLAEVHDVLASNLAGEALKEKVKDMGCADALDLDKTEEDARVYFEDVAEHLGLLLGMIDAQFEPTAKQIALELSYGHIAYDLLIYYFEPGHKYYALQEGHLIGFTLCTTHYETRAFCLDGEITRWDGHKFTHKKRTFSIPQYNGTTELSKLPCRIITDDIRSKLTARGKLYASLAGVHYKSYKGHRIVIDYRAYKARRGYTCDSSDNMSDVSEDELEQHPALVHSKHKSRRGEKIPDVPEEELDQLPAFVYGFELKNKSWESFHIEDIEDIKFDENAWDHLVIDEDVKNLIKGLVHVTTNANTSRHIVSDVITGKGGGLIAALHGPPGTGKTLTAEAVAEHLQRPLYTISSLELSTFPSTLESRLSGILSLATTWDALERNALVSVALKVLEYHRGVLFLTTNRIQTFDEAFLSRFSIAIKYPELNASARLTIWRKFFELAGCPLWGSEAEGFVTLDGKEPRCYVSLSDLEVLAQKPFNGQYTLVIMPTRYSFQLPGRTIKNLARTAQALALSAKEPLSLDHVKVVVRTQEKFLMEFAQSRS